jgi:hypothetical protein
MSDAAWDETRVRLRDAILAAVRAQLEVGRSGKVIARRLDTEPGALSRLKHGFESRWGHQIDFVECFRSGFEKHSNVSRTHWRASYCLVRIASAFSS